MKVHSSTGIKVLLNEWALGCHFIAPVEHGFVVEVIGLRFRFPTFLAIGLGIILLLVLANLSRGIDKIACIAELSCNIFHR